MADKSSGALNYKTYRKETDATPEEQEAQQNTSLGRSMLKMAAFPGTFTKMMKNEKSWGEAQDAAEQEKAREHTRGVKGMKKGGTVSSASKRADGIATKGKTKGRFV